MPPTCQYLSFIHMLARDVYKFLSISNDVVTPYGSVASPQHIHHACDVPAQATLHSSSVSPRLQAVRQRLFNSASAAVHSAFVVCSDSLSYIIACVFSSVYINSNTLPRAIIIAYTLRVVCVRNVVCLSQAISSCALHDVTALLHDRQHGARVSVACSARLYSMIRSMLAWSVVPVVPIHTDIMLLPQVSVPCRRSANAVLTLRNMANREYNNKILKADTAVGDRKAKTPFYFRILMFDDRVSFPFNGCKGKNVYSHLVIFFRRRRRRRR